MVTVPPSDDGREYKYLQEGVHLLLDSVDKPPLDDQAVGGKINAESLKTGLMMQFYMNLCNKKSDEE